MENHYRSAIGAASRRLGAVAQKPPMQKFQWFNVASVSQNGVSL
jgi:hypothetical protein